MAQPQYGYGQQPQHYGSQNLNFYQSSFSGQPVSGTTTPFQAYSGGVQSNAYTGAGFSGGFSQPGVSGRMGESGGLRTGWLAAFGTEGYDGEPPLLEELGVNFGHIKTKTLAVLSPFSISEHLMDDSDLAGPLLFFLLFGFFLLAGGKLHFGYIYGLALLGSSSLHVILSLMSPPLSPAEQAAQSQEGRDHPSGYSGGSRHFSSTLTLARSASTLGYCLLPLCLTSLIGILVPLDSLFGYILTSAAIAWGTYSATAIFCSVGRMTSMRFLVAYPLALFYTGFGIMSIFSSRGTGGLEQRARGG